MGFWTIPFNAAKSHERKRCEMRISRSAKGVLARVVAATAAVALTLGTFAPMAPAVAEGVSGDAG